MRTVLIPIVWIFMFWQAATAAMLTVDLNGGADYTAIKYAINAAANGDTVLVMPGEYVIEDPITFWGKAITVKSEGGPEVTTIRMADSEETVLIFKNGETSASLLQGFTLTGGEGFWENTFNYGGGIYCSGSSPTIQSCVISGNSADAGGGVYCDNASPNLIGCTISGNSGGGLHIEYGSPTLTDCTISANNAGGITVGMDSSLTLSGCTISGNSVITGTAGISWGGTGSLTLTDCVISGNLSSPRAIYPYSHYDVGGLRCTCGTINLTRCTITGNSASDGAGGVFIQSCPSPSGTHVAMTSCIVWDNIGNIGNSIVAQENTDLAVTYSCIEGKEVWPGEGNIDRDPLFYGWGGSAEVYVDGSSPRPGDGSQGDPYKDLDRAFEYSLALGAGSPCIGSGMDGANMGADRGVGGAPGGRSRLIHLAAGTYGLRDMHFAHRVSIYGSGEAETVLEGTVWGLRSRPVLSHLKVTGGGIVVCGREAPEILQCTVSGGGIYCGPGSSTILSRCTISDASNGGGVGCSGSFLTMTDCTISSSQWACGGLFCSSSSSVTATNCRIPRVGVDDSSATLTGCTISEVVPELCYSIVGCTRSSLSMMDCTISGLDCQVSSSATVSNSIILNGVFCADNSSPDFTNCTILGAVDSGALWCGSDSSPTLTNCIVWGDVSNSIVLDGATASASATYSCIRGDEVWPGEGNINADPLFVRMAYLDDQGTPESEDDVWVEGDYHLQPGSPCIDAGTSEGTPTSDIEGHGRLCGKSVDIGAYEYGDCPRSETPFLRGNANADSATDISDAVAILNYLFLGYKNVPCEQAGDANDDGLIDISDGVYVLNFLFLGGKAIEPPVGTCGLDPTGHSLPCESFPGCQ